MEHKERNYFSLVLLLLRVGNSTVRLYFKKQWDDLGLFPVWTDSPQNGADLLKKYKPFQHEKDKVKLGDTSTWDLLLLVKALLTFVTDKSHVAALRCLREMRNDLFHTHTPKMGTDEFKNKWQDACNALTLFGATPDDFKQVTQDSGTWKDLKHFIQQCSNRDKETLDAVTIGIQELQKIQETIAQQGAYTYVEAKDNAQVAVGDKVSWTNQYPSLPSTPSEQDVEIASTNLKSSVKDRTELLQVGSPVLVNARTDDIFTNLMIRKHHSKLEGGRMLEGYCEMSSTSVNHIEEIFIGKEKNPKSIQITGKPGIGKTFFCKKIVRDWANNQLFSSPERSTTHGFQFAYLLKFRDLNSLENDRLNLAELLNLSSLLDGKSMVDESLMKYFIDNPDKVLIILDGYDEYKYGQNIADNYIPPYPNNPLERMPAQALLSKLIKKQILNNSVIIVTSRPGEADKLGETHFDEYVQINGFSPDQVTEFVEKYFAANEGMKTKVVEFVKTNVSITSCCHIPMMSFLMCGYLEWYLENTKHKLPATDASTTDLFSEMITTFMKEPHKDHKNTCGETASNPIEEVLLKIAEFAAKLLENKKLVFEEKDMKDNLSPQEIEILKASGLLNCSGNARKGPYEVQQLFEFIHLTVQEFLSAQWFVATNKIPEKQTSGMVFQFMSGLLVRKNDEMMTQIFQTVKPDGASSVFYNEQRLLPLRCLCEYGDEILTDKLLYDSHHQYCDSDGEIVFREVADMDCTAISWLVDSLSRLQKSRSELRRVEKLSIRNSPLSLFGVKSLCASVCRLSTVTGLTLYYCKLDDKCAKCIGAIIANKIITYLSLHGNNITDVGARYLCSNVVKDSCTVTELHLSCNELITDECREALRKYAQQYKPGVKLVI